MTSTTERTPPSAENFQRAFDLLHRPDWKLSTLPELMAAARHVAMVNGLAQRLANGQGMTLPNHGADPTALADQAPPAPPLRAWDFPARLGSDRANGQTERRRRDTAGVDRKRLAAGDRDD